VARAHAWDDVVARLMTALEAAASSYCSSNRSRSTFSSATLSL
jgi:hypothetical protein